VAIASNEKGLSGCYILSSRKFVVSTEPLDSAAINSLDVSKSK
jgi:hypothetical protein